METVEPVKPHVQAENMTQPQGVYTTVKKILYSHVGNNKGTFCVWHTVYLLNIRDVATHNPGMVTIKGKSVVVIQFFALVCEMV